MNEFAYEGIEMPGQDYWSDGGYETADPAEGGIAALEAAFRRLTPNSSLLLNVTGGEAR